MSAALGQLFGSGVGVALSPIPIIAVILMLTTPRGRATGAAFLSGWLVGLTAATAIVLLVAGGSDQPGSSASDGAHIATLVIGLLFLALAVRQWTTRPREGAEPELPAWMAGIDSFSTPKCFALGAALSGLNPKNLAMAVSAGLALAQTGASTTGTAAGLLIFVIIGSTTVAGPVIGSRFAPARTAPVLVTAKQWLGHNNATIMIVLFTILGATKTGEGLASILH